MWKLLLGKLLIISGISNSKQAFPTFFYLNLYIRHISWVHNHINMLSLVQLNGEFVSKRKIDNLLIVNTNCHKLHLFVVVAQSYLEKFISRKCYYHCWVRSFFVEIHFLWSHLHPRLRIVLIIKSHYLHLQFIEPFGGWNRYMQIYFWKRRVFI